MFYSFFLHSGLVHFLPLANVFHRNAERGESEPCVTGCEEIMSNFHIFPCGVLNTGEYTHIENLINEEIYEMKKTLKRWNQNIKKIEALTSQVSL